MHQQINLYQPVIVKGSGTVTSSSVIIALCATSLLLLVIYSYGIYSVVRLERHVSEAREQQQRQNALLTLNAANASSGDLPSLQAQVKSLTTILSDHKRALQLLRIGTAGGDSGFSARLIALANQHIDGMWLDHIVLGSNNGVESLSGGTIDAELVPMFLSRLASEPALRGTRINQFQLTGRNVPTDTTGETSNSIQFRATGVPNKTPDDTKHDGTHDNHASTAQTATAGGQS